MVDFKDLEGKVLTKIEGTEGDDELIFTCQDGAVYYLYHEQCCCEHVYLESVVGNLDNLINSPILQAEEVTNIEEPSNLPEWDDSYTWTFYKLATAKGYVTLRWYGCSNGYYSESVEFKLR